MNKTKIMIIVKKLFEFGDVVIDNCGEIGDASVKLDGLEHKIGPTSSISGIIILHSIIVDVVENLIKTHKTIPVFSSTNIDGGAEHNLIIFSEYDKQIHYMK